MADLIAYKVATATDMAALDTGVFHGAPIDVADGYIHLSTAAQLTETVARHFAGQRDLTVLAVDLAALGAAVRWEASRHGQLFPHVYAPLVPAVILARAALEREIDGSVRLPRVAAAWVRRVI